MKILHVVPGLNEKGNGIAVAAKLIAGDQAKSGAEVEVVDTKDFISTSSTSTSSLRLRIVSNHFGEELERDWAWCDVLCLPTLSENFGLVVAEALERGKRVVVTDGAPAWEPPPEAAEVEVERRGGRWWDRLCYVRGFRDGTDAERVKLLKEALHEQCVV